jgi:hypothetical protein
MVLDGYFFKVWPSPRACGGPAEARGLCQDGGGRRQGPRASQVGGVLALGCVGRRRGVWGEAPGVVATPATSASGAVLAWAFAHDHRWLLPAIAPFSVYISYAVHERSHAELFSRFGTMLAAMHGMPQRVAFGDFIL